MTLPPQSAAAGLQLELVLACSEGKSNEDCVEAILSDSHDLLAFDHKFGTTIMLVLDESLKREEVERVVSLEEILKLDLKKPITVRPGEKTEPEK